MNKWKIAFIGLLIIASFLIGVYVGRYEAYSQIDRLIDLSVNNALLRIK